MSLYAYLTARSDRCQHGWHLELQGCSQCGVDLKFKRQAATTAAHPDDRARVEAAIRVAAASGLPFSANSIRSVHNVRGPVVGATFTALRQAGVIRPRGDVTSTDPGTHGHRIFEWEAA